MNLKSALGTLIQILTVIANLTSSKIDDTILGLLKALYASDAFLDVLQKLIDSWGTSIPEGAMAQIEPTPELCEAFNASPALQAWANAQPAPNVPPGAEAIGIGTIITVLTNLPTIIALLRALFSGNLGTVK